MVLKYLGSSLLMLAGLTALLIVALALLPGRWLAERIEPVAASALGVPVTLERLGLRLFSMKPGVHGRGLAITTDDGEPLLEASVFSARVDLASLLAGKVVIDSIRIGESEIWLERGRSGQLNWAPVTNALGLEQDRNDTADATSLPVMREVQLEDVTWHLDDAVSGHQAELNLSLNGSTAYPARPTDIQFAGEVNAVPIDVSATLGSLAGAALPPEQLDLELDARSGSNSVVLDGVVSSLGEGSPVSLDVNFRMQLRALDRLATLLRMQLPTLPHIELAGDLHRNGPEFLLKGLDAKLGSSDLDGDVRLNLGTHPVTLYANLLSRTLAARDVNAVISELSGDPAADTAADGPGAVTGSSRLLPDQPLGLAALTSHFNGAVAYEARQIESDNWPVESVDLRAEVQRQRLSLTPATFGIAGGELEMDLELDAGSDPVSTTAELKIRGMNLKHVMRQLGVDDDSFGAIGGRGKFWTSGDTIAEMAASSDGGLFLLMTGGKVDALLTELAGVDLMESIALLIDPGKSMTPIDCGYLDLHAKNGVVSISRLVLDTADTVFRGDGSIDLNDETLDVTLEPQPKDVSILSAQTSVNIGGTLASPAVSPGRELAGKALAAATLAVVAAPAAAILPLIQPASGEDSRYCEGLVKAIDKPR